MTGTLHWQHHVDEDYECGDEDKGNYDKHDDKEEGSPVGRRRRGRRPGRSRANKDYNQAIINMIKIIHRMMIYIMQEEEGDDGDVGNAYEYALDEEEDRRSH